MTTLEAVKLAWIRTINEFVSDGFHLNIGISLFFSPEITCIIENLKFPRNITKYMGGSDILHCYFIRIKK